ncbi:3'-5' exonuclease [Rhodobacteraceae bacterium CCMM004]|nr:3'-5' exonuclease [Rhodobacteraceae bacterium CCMM004]
METWPLRLRVFLFFCLIVGAGWLVVLGGLWLAARQMGAEAPIGALSTVAVAALFGLAAVAAGVWLLFDENVAKPLERIAADLRARTHVGVGRGLDLKAARWLGDIGPAAEALVRAHDAARRDTTREAQRQTEALKAERARLLRILSDIPIAVLVMNQRHQIVAYDGQAAALMAKESPPRLNASLFDYLDEVSVKAGLDALPDRGAARIGVTVTGRSGADYTGHLRGFGGQAGYSLMLEPLDPDADRPMVYDFDLLDRDTPADLADTPLRSLSFVVFDSETTGLLPHKDHVVQIGAVRVVNGRVIPGEQFETLVNPGVPIPPASTKVHRVSDDMVTGAPDMAAASRAFHAYASGSVVVAHNAPFDMAFLHRAAKELDLVWDHVVLDTVLISAIVFGGSARHTLGAVCERLDYQIPAHLRHTALGDAQATAEALCRMLPILEARGIRTLRRLREEMGRHTRIVEDANR